MARGSRQATRQAIISAATRVFSESGYAGSTVDAIAERAGLTTGALYSNFGGKREVFLEVLRRAVGYDAAPDRAAQGRLEADGRDFLRSVEEDPAGFRLLLWAVLESSHDTEIGEVVAQVLRDQRVLQQQIAAAWMQVDPQSPAAVDAGVLLNSMAIGFTVERLVDPEGLSVEQGLRILAAQVRRLRADP